MRATSWSLAVVGLMFLGGTLPIRLVVTASSAPPDARPNAKSDESSRSLSALIDSIRKAEQQFANLETTVRKRRSRPGIVVQVKGNRRKSVTAAGPQEEVVARTVLQGDRFYSKIAITRKFNKTPSVHVERVVAFDGRQTQVVEIGSAVNVHDGRTTFARAAPPQSWPLAINIPLSSFLEASSADSVSALDAASGSLDSLVADDARPSLGVELRIGGEETLKGLACVRLEFHQENPQDGRECLVHLWLAKDRHLIPVKQQVFSESDNDRRLRSESRVEDWLQVQKTLWLPKRIVWINYDPDATKDAKYKEVRSETWTLDKASLAPQSPEELFRDLPRTTGLPVFRIKQGRLEDTFSPPQPARSDSGGKDTKLLQVIDRLREEEERYNRLSVDATEVRTSNHVMGGRDKTRTTQFHCLLAGDKALTDAHHETWHFDGSFRPMLWTEGFDGHTYRAYGRHPPPDAGGYAWVSSSNLFEKGTTLCPAMLRPHSALIAWAPSYRRLLEILSPPVGAAQRGRPNSIELAGEATCDQLQCYVLSLRPGANVPAKCLLWLAKDRNLIPVRFEEYIDEQTLPVRLEVIDNLREAAAGVWYPAHKIRYLFRPRGRASVAEGCLFVDQTWDYTVKSVLLDVTTPAETFSQIPVDEGIDVQYFDKFGKHFSTITQTTKSVPEMRPGK